MTLVVRWSKAVVDLDHSNALTVGGRLPAGAKILTMLASWSGGIFMFSVAIVAQGRVIAQFSDRSVPRFVLARNCVAPHGLSPTPTTSKELMLTGCTSVGQYLSPSVEIRDAHE